MDFKSESQFDLYVQQRMATAFDKACRRLGIGSTDPLTSKLAFVIVDLSKRGFRDPDTLCDEALKALNPKVAA